MRYNKLGCSDTEVSVLCLGTMTWGEQNNETEAHQQLDLALASGINFIDTAELYPVPPRAETYGLTEQYIGTWLAQRRACRDRIVLATKVCARADWIPHIRGGATRLDRHHIETALNASLRRLQTDYIDLYQLHWPDRSTNFFGRLGYHPQPDPDATPIAETLSVLADLVRVGKIRHVGISNETPWGAMEYLRLSHSENLPRIVSIQNPYNLLNRSFEIGLAEIAHRESVGLLAYSPLGFGVLSGKYLHDARPKGARLTLFEGYQRYTNLQGMKATEAYVRLAREHHLDPAQMALAFINARPFVTSNIIGATTLAQLRTNLGSLDADLPEALLAALEEIHRLYPNPCP